MLTKQFNVIFHRDSFQKVIWMHFLIGLEVFNSSQEKYLCCCDSRDCGNTYFVKDNNAVVGLAKNMNQKFVRTDRSNSKTSGKKIPRHCMIAKYALPCFCFK